METSLRNTLRLIITSCRRLLEEDYRLQLEGRYGIRADGEMEPLSGLDQIWTPHSSKRPAWRHRSSFAPRDAPGKRAEPGDRSLRARKRLYRLKPPGCPQADGTTRNAGLIVESIGQKELSKGFLQFLMISPEALRDKADGGYRFYLELMLDDLGQTLGALFDRSLPQSILFPSPTCLSQILDLLNQPELVPVWGDDETIGWIYQYFTPPELRDQVRKESSAPRNSNELAFRNQFYTPRYVVEFLVDNTLGRTWYEMRQGNTNLVEQCQYLIHRKHPVFLSPGEEPPQPYDRRKAGYGDPVWPAKCGPDPILRLEDIGDIFAYALTVGGYHYAREHLGLECGDFANQQSASIPKNWVPGMAVLRNCAAACSSSSAVIIILGMIRKAKPLDSQVTEALHNASASSGIWRFRVYILSGETRPTHIEDPRSSLRLRSFLAVCLRPAGNDLPGSL